MKIMYITANAGGILKYIKQISEKINLDATQVVISSINHKDMVEKDLEKIDKKIYLDMKEGRNLIDNIALIKKLRNIIKKEKPDIVYINGSRISFISRIALLGLKDISVIFNSHGWNFKNRFKIFFERYFAKKTDIIINTSKIEQEKAKKNNIIPKLEMIHINNGIDFKKYENLNKDKKLKEEKVKKIREDLDISEYQKAIVQLGNINEKRDPFIFLNIILALIKMGYNIKAIMIGDGEKEYINKIMKFAEENNILDKIEITGWVDNLPEYLSAMDIAISTVKEENTPITLAEYMAAKLPIVCNNSEINLEILDKGTFGKIVRVGDIEDYVHKVQEIFMDFSKEKKSLESAYDYSNKNYNINTMVKKHEEIFKILYEEK